MPTILKTIKLRVPSDIIYRALKDTRLEELFPEFFIGVTRKLRADSAGKELKFWTTAERSQIEIHETFKLSVSDASNTEIQYITEINVDEENVVVQSIVQTHIANILYSLLMLETGYVNGLMMKKKHILQ